MGIHTQLQEPNVLFLLLLGDVLQPVNRFSMFLQTRNLVFNSANAKLNQLMESLRDISQIDGPYFKENAESFLYTAYNRLTFDRIRGNALPGNNIDIDKTIREFKTKIKEPFFNALLTEISDAMNIAGKEVRAFDVFNTVDNSTKLQKFDMLKDLVQSYGNEQRSTFKNDENVAPPLFTFSGDVDPSINYFLADFELCLTQLKKEQNEKISIMIREKKN